MCPTKMKLIIPLTNSGRKYGYITWRKEYDEKIKALFGEKDHVDLKFDNSYQKNKAIDWKKRRIGITGTITRQLSGKKSEIIIEKQTKNCWGVSFN